jgi:hypothetical protein
MIMMITKDFFFINFILFFFHFKKLLQMLSFILYNLKFKILLLPLLRVFFTFGICSSNSNSNSSSSSSSSSSKSKLYYVLIILKVGIDLVKTTIHFSNE